MNVQIINRIRSNLAAGNFQAKFPPVSAEALETAEAALGFKIPLLLRLIYTNVANGGFGPGYGIIGIDGGHASDLGTLVETYDEINRGAKYLELEWKTGLLPFCGWGCNIFSCVDCSDLQYPVYQSEECKTRAQSYSFEKFFEMWLDGADILGISSSPRRTGEIINPFTRNRTRVSGSADSHETKGKPKSGDVNPSE